MRGGIQMRKVIVEPFALSVPAGSNVSTLGRIRPVSSAPALSTSAAEANLSFLYDLDAKAGDLRIEGKATQVQDIFALATEKSMEGFRFSPKSLGGIRGCATKPVQPETEKRLFFQA